MLALEVAYWTVGKACDVMAKHDESFGDVMPKAARCVPGLSQCGSNSG